MTFLGKIRISDPWKWFVLRRMAKWISNNLISLMPSKLAKISRGQLMQPPVPKQDPNTLQCSKSGPFSSKIASKRISPSSGSYVDKKTFTLVSRKHSLSIFPNFLILNMEEQMFRVVVQCRCPVPTLSLHPYLLTVLETSHSLKHLQLMIGR